MSESIILLMSLLSVIGIVVFVNSRAYYYYKYLLFKKGVRDVSALTFFFSNKDILLKLQVALPLPIIIANADLELNELRKRVNKQTILSYIAITTIVLIRLFLIKD